MQIGELIVVRLFLKGVIIGLSIAAPVGPIGILCIRRTLAGGRLVGFITGLGAASADAIYGCIAGFGLTFLSHFLISQQIWLRLIGGVFLCYLGIRTFSSTQAEKSVKTGGNGLLGAYTTTFILTLTNPLTVLSFAAIFSGLGLVNNQGDYLASAALVLGVLLGSATWWLMLSSSVAYLGNRFSLFDLKWVNRISGIVITGFGIYALLSALGSFL